MHAQIVHGLSAAEYHAHPAISKSKLDQIARSPFHYHAAYLSPEKPERDETAAMKLGTLAHCAVLEPDQLEHRYIIQPPELDMRSAAGKAWKAGIKDGFTVISDEMNKAACRIDTSLRRLPDIASALSIGKPEVSVFYRDEITGLDLKARLDWVHECGDGGVIILDVKTTQDASPRQFARSVAAYRYHCQSAYYTDLYQKASGRTVHAFVFAVCESNAPHAAACYQLTEAATHRGRALYREDLQLLKSCIDRNTWPAYGDEVQPLDLPSWAMNEY